MRDLEQGIDQLDADAFDLNEVTSGDLEQKDRPRAPYDTDFLERVLAVPDLVPAGCEVKPLESGQWSWLPPGKTEPVRITTRRELFEEHADSYEFFTPGSPLFPFDTAVDTDDDVPEDLEQWLARR